MASPRSALAAAPTFLNVCTGLGVQLPALQPVANTGGAALTGILAPVDTALNGVVGSVNTNLTQALSGQTLGVSVIDPSTGTLASVPASQCALTASGYQVNNNTGLSLGGGQITGLGGTLNAAATAGDSSAIALGNGSSTGTGLSNAVSLGTGASTTVANSVALGAGSVAARGAATAPYAAFGLNGTPQTSTGEVSIGAPNATRQITNLAAGSAGTDAVNVSQLQGAAGALGSSVAGGLGGGATYNGVTGQISNPNYTIQGNVYQSTGNALTEVDNTLTSLLRGTEGPFVSDNTAGVLPAAATGLNATAGGFGATATGAGSVVVGNSASDGGAAGSSVFGSGARVSAGVSGSNAAIGQGSVAATGALTGYTALGLRATQNSVGEVSVGSLGAARQLTNVAAGLAPTDAVNVAQLQGTADTLANSIASLNLSVGTSPVQYSSASAPTTPNAAVPSNDATLVGLNANAPVALHNVANGTLAAGATDAANTGQLYAANQSLASILDGGAGYNSSTGQFTNPSYTIAGTSYTTIGSALNALASLSGGGGSQQSAFVHNNSYGQSAPAASGDDAIAGGYGAVSMGTSTTSIGSASQATDDGATAIGAGAVASADPTTAVGTNAAATADEASAFGAFATASGVNSTALGRSATAAGGNATAVGYGASATGNNSIALGANSTDDGVDNVVSVGAVGAERRITNLAAGTLSATSTDAVNGSQLYQTNVQLASLGHSALQYDTDGAGHTLSSVSLSSDQGGPVVIHNLAPGVATTDAATVGQVQSATANSVQYSTVNGVRSNTIALVGGSQGGVTISNLAAGVAATDAVNVGQLQAYASGSLTQANAYTDQQVSNLAALTQKQISHVKEVAAGGTALALAATGLRYQDTPGKFSISGATSYYHDQMGLAFGLGTTSENGRIRVNAALTASPTAPQGDIGAVVGASFTLN